MLWPSLATERISRMQWISPSENDAASTSLKKCLWDAADQFRANSVLKAQEYSGPTLGLFAKLGT